jgi:hypothetical protein
MWKHIDGKGKVDTRFRGGKTQRGRESGASRRTKDNKLTMAGWHNTQNRTQESFPSTICNGKRSRALRGVK